MSGVWVFKNGVVRENPAPEAVGGGGEGQIARRKVLVHTAMNEVNTSYDVLESKLRSLGWERYDDDPDLLQFQKPSTVHLISLRKDFSKFTSVNMYDMT